MDDDRRLIEETFPIKEISDESVYDKRIREGHISVLHPWPARRPLAASIATIYTSLIGFKHEKDLKSKVKKTIKLAKWENFNKFEPTQEAKKDIITKKIRPKILDPFSGGGSIPLQAFRLGCDVYAVDYNPVANIILKCGIEFINKYSTRSKNSGLALDAPNELYEKFKKWSNWIYEQLEKDVGIFYHNPKKNITNIAYLWAHTITCNNPKCKAAIPILNHLWLCKKTKQKVVLFPKKEKNSVKFSIIDSLKKSIPKGFDPNKGNVARANVTCFVCNSTIPSKDVKKQFVNGNSYETMLCVISSQKGTRGKIYTIPTLQDLDSFSSAEKYLKKILSFGEKSNINLIPNEPLPELHSHRGSGGVLRLYGFKTYGDLFNKRQLAVLVLIVKKIKECIKLIEDTENSKQDSIVISTYLAIVLDSLLNYYCKLCPLNVTGGRGVANALGTWNFSMKYGYAESNPLNLVAASWKKISEKILTYLQIDFHSDANIEIKMASATSLPFPNEYFDGVFTDPPYYDNIPYANLSDFFYVWLKRSIGELYPDIFSTLLTPKSDEIISELQYSADKKKSEGNKALKDSTYFEETLSKAFQEIFRVLKNDKIAYIVYAHKSTLGWETMINSLLNSGLIVTAAWPINTEMKGRIQSQETAALASSIYMVCRKWKKEPHCTYNDVKKEMQDYLDKKLDFLWTQGIKGADFFISAIGSAIEVFGKYEKITDYEDKPILVSQLLEDVRKIVSEYAIRKVLRGEVGGEISTMTRFYVLWRSAYGQAKVPFDDARKLATSLGVNLEQEWNKGFIKKDKEFVRVIGPEDRSVDEIKEPTELIDVLHKVLILWRYETKEAWEKVLTESGYANNDTFWRVAQSISESLPIQIQEKKWLDDFLTGFTESGKTDTLRKKLITDPEYHR